jgi:hypothetical protein
MKKIIFILSAVCFTVVTLKAQTTSFGFKAGVNANTFTLKSDAAGNETRLTLTSPGFHIGGLADIKFSPNFSLQPQLLFASKGGKLEQGGNETKFNFYTIDVPLNLLYNSNGFFIGAGPNFSYGISGKGKASGQDEVDLFEEDALGVDQKFKRFEIGVNATMGYRFPGGFLLSTNFTPGLSDSFDDPNDTKATNSFWGFSIGYVFGSGKATTTTSK